MGGAALLAAVGHDGVAGILKNIGGDEFLRGGYQNRDLLGAEVGHRTEWVDSSNKADLGFENIADTCEHFLMEEHVADFFAGAGEKALRCRFRIEALVEHIDGGLGDAAVAGE